MRRPANYGWEFIAPAVLLITVFVVVPCVWGIGLSFSHFDAIGPAKFAGVSNFTRLSGDPMVALTLKRTALYVILTVPVGLISGLGVALALDAKWFRGRGVVRGLYFLPNVTSLAAVAFVWEWILNPEFGLVNAGLRAMHLAMPSVAMVGVWHGLGFTVLFYLSGLKSIPGELREAAEIDGAGAWQTFQSITWPLLTPTTMFLMITGVIGGFLVFQSVFIMTGGGPIDATRVYMFYLFEAAFKGLEFGYASAMAVVLFVLVMMLTAMQWAFFGRRMEALS